MQIVKEERGNKGAAMTTLLSIPGRYMVLMPDSKTKGVSRKISVDSERKKLKQTMAELELPERMGYIVRTAGIGKEKDELKRDFDYLVRLFEGIISRKDQIKAPAQLYQESNLVIRSIRDYFSTEMDEVLIDDQKIFQDAKDFFSLVMPELTNLVKQHRERRPIFSRYQIEEQIEGLAKNQIPLPSGGSIVIDQTEALVAIDVNSGKMASESGIEATAAKTNLEAAAEVGRQLRLRDLGGLVVIDFIDMRDRKHIRDVEKELRKALKDDKAKVTVGRISQFGLLEMSRQRLKPTLSVGAYLECPHCQGKGRIKSVENQSIGLLRQVHAAASKGHIGHIEASVPLDVANYLLNQKRQTLNDLEQRLNLRITIIGHFDLVPGQLNIELHKREKSADDKRDIMPVSHANQIEIALAAQQNETDKSEAEHDSTETKTAESEGSSEESGAESRNRKRRRRRRKGRRSDDQGTDQVHEVSNEESPVDDTTEQVEPATHPPTDKINPEATATPSTGEKPKRRRSRRSPKKPEVEPTPTTEAPVSETLTSESSEPANPNQSSVEKPQQQQNASKPATEKVSEGSANTTSEQPVEEKPKRRPRRTAKKPAEPVATTVETTASEQPAEEKPKRRPRRTTKKPAEPVAATVETTASEQPAEEKPKRRPRRTANKSAEPVATTVETTASEQPVEEKPKRRPRRTANKSAEPVTATMETTASEQPAEEKPKRRPRKTANKSVEPVTSTTDTIATKQPTEEKPKRRTRKTTKKTEKLVIDTATAVTTEQSTEEKPKRRPRRTTKKTVDSVRPGETPET